MSIHAVPPPSIEPVINLSSWFYFKAHREGKPDTYHLCGYDVDHHEGRVSSTITQILKNDSLIVTRSGRQYKLIGESGTNRDALYVLSNWSDWFSSTVERVQNINDLNNLSIIEDSNDEH